MFSPNGAVVNSPGRKPWEGTAPNSRAPTGRKSLLPGEDSAAPLGLFTFYILRYPGLSPWAIDCRPLGANHVRTTPANSQRSLDLTLRPSRAVRPAWRPAGIARHRQGLGARRLGRHAQQSLDSPGMAARALGRFLVADQRFKGVLAFLAFVFVKRLASFSLSRHHVRRRR